MNNDIKIGVIGKIIEGEACGWFVRIKEDFEDTGGYFILITKKTEMSEEDYDYWAQDKNTMLEMIKEFRWKINWLDEKS